MFSGFKSLSFMGVSDSQMFLTEKDLNSMELNFLVKVPSLGELRDVEDDDDGFRTPTSLDHKIPESLRCPPAPRKPKPIPSTKRKAGRRRIMLDLSNEIDSLFPPALLVDLRVKIKKIRRGDETK
nr:cyclin-dependent protein kinase inhibitor smr3 [Quercus suber]